MKISIYATPFRSTEMAELAKDFIEKSIGSGIKVCLAPSVLDALKEDNIIIDSLLNYTVGSPDSVEPDTDFVISLGGDGTFLRAAHWCGSYQIPIAGVNMGHLGYLPSYNPVDLPRLLELLTNGKYDIEMRSMLSIEIPDENRKKVGSCWMYGLNEVAILKQDTASMISIPVKLNSKELGVYDADGLIVSTPTGSTAYNLSVGGPVLQPTMPAIVLSPIADHSLTMRPMVISEDAELEVTAIGRISSFRVSLDGNSFTLPAGTPVKIRKGDFGCRIVVRKGSLFASTLRSKLLWGKPKIVE